jgi:hypothetical protein
MAENKSPLNKVGWAILAVLMLFVIALFFLVKKESQGELPLPENEEPSAPQVLTEGWYRFSNEDNTFTIDYPLLAETITDERDMQEIGYLPTCNSETGIVCIYFPPKTYPETNFEGAGVSVNITDSTTSSECLTQNVNERETEGPQIIGGITFERFFAGDAATSHQSNGFNYRAWRRNTCYEITTRLNTSTFEVHAEGSINRFREEDRITMMRIMDEVVKSFTFAF